MKVTAGVAAAGIGIMLLSMALFSPSALSIFRSPESIMFLFKVLTLALYVFLFANLGQLLVFSMILVTIRDLVRAEARRRPKKRRKGLDDDDQGN
jgi:hypothetical protein